MLKALKNPLTITLVSIFIIGLILRVISVYPDNTIIGFDQARDLMSTITIFRDHHLRIIGPTAGNNANLHHGVLFLYYMLIPLFLFKGNPMAVVYWNILFNGLAAVAIYFLSKAIFKNNLMALSSAAIVAVEYQLIQFSGWLSNPTATVLTVPLFYIGLWQYYQKKSWGLVLALVSLGLTIEFELFYIYLIPILILFWLIFRPKLPSTKLAAISILGFLLTTSTMVATEIKFKFSSIPALFEEGGGRHASLWEKINQFWGQFSPIFSNNLFPQDPALGAALATIILLALIFYLVKAKNKSERGKVAFVLLYLLSPGIMVVLGIHRAPWFLIGRPVAIALAVGFLIWKLPKALAVILLLAIIFFNTQADLTINQTGQSLLDADKAALLRTQLKVIDYTYQNSNGDNFLINTVTNPLYINAMWSYDYSWYGLQKYGYLPHWAGGDQLYPYNNLPGFQPGIKYLFVIIDDSPRVPAGYKDAATEWGDSRSQLIEQKDFDGILVQKRIFTSLTN